MQLHLKQYFVKDLHLEQIEKPQEGESDFEFSFNTLFYSAIKQEFYLIFKIDMKNPDSFLCNMNFCFVFGTDEDITDKFMRSLFPLVNAPAIAFPYIRSYITNLTISSGFQPTILPSINFTKVINKGTVKIDDIPLIRDEAQNPI